MPSGFGLGAVAPLALLTILALLLLPTAPWCLDIFVMLNIASSFLLVLLALRIDSALKLSTFPTILLCAALFRLALNVASTRMILGEGEAGVVISAFGRVVAGGSLLVGLALFLILVAIQFLVVAKGSERVAEVAARFSLDAMPGRQMAIDADLRAGAFDQLEAGRRRQALQRESRFFGAMDGAMKFVKGDAIAGLIITAINLFGGLAIGTMEHGVPLGEAVARWSVLSIGDGLCAQIPALLVALAAGIVVTRVDEEGTHAGSIDVLLREVFTEPRHLALASLTPLAIGVLPGVPPLLPLVTSAALALSAGLLSFLRTKGTASVEPRSAEEEAGAGGPSAPIPVLRASVVLELGEGLCAELSGESGFARLEEELRLARRVIFDELGVRVPEVVVHRAGYRLGRREVRVKFYDLAVWSEQIRAAAAWTIERPGRVLDEGLRHPFSGNVILPADVRTETTFGLERRLAISLLVAASAHPGEFLGVAEVQQRLDALETVASGLVEALLPQLIGLPQLSRLLRELADEGVPLHDLRRVLETLVAVLGDASAEPSMSDAVFDALTPVWAGSLARRGRLHLWTWTPSVEVFQQDDAVQCTQLLNAACATIPGEAWRPCIAIPRRLRRHASARLRECWPEARVLGIESLPRDLPIVHLGELRAGSEASPDAAPA